VGLKLNRTKQLLIYEGHENLLGDNIFTIKESTETLIDASKEVGVEVNAKKTNCMLLSCQQNAGQNLYMKTANRSSEYVAQFRYLRMVVRNQNLIQEKIKRRLNSGNSFYHSVQSLLSSRLLSKR
jgi:hypothetical protein